MLIFCTVLDYYSATVSNYQVVYRFINYQYSHNLANMFVNGYTNERIKKGFEKLYLKCKFLGFFINGLYLG